MPVKLSYHNHPPYSWLFYPQDRGYTYRALDTINNLLDNIQILGNKSDFQDLNVIIKNYQYYGFDIKLPDVLNNNFEPNNCETIYYYDKYGKCYSYNAGGHGGKETLKNLRNHTVDTLKFGFAFHQQYVDYYPSAPSYISSNTALKSNGEYVEGYQLSASCNGGGANILTASQVKDIATQWTDRLGTYQPTWAYVDVQ